MKGLLLKDWYMVLKEAKYYLPFHFFYAVIAAFTNMWLVFIMINIIMGTFMVKTLMAMEEQNKWDNLAISLPLTVEEKVTEKYLMGFFCGMVANMITFVVLWIGKPALQKNADVPLLPFFLLCTAVIVFLLALELPVLFWFGTVRGRLVFMASCGVGTAISAAVCSALAEKMMTTEQVTKTGMALVLAAALVVTAVAAIISVKLSIHIYEKREF